MSAILCHVITCGRTCRPLFALSTEGKTVGGETLEKTRYILKKTKSLKKCRMSGKKKQRNAFYFYMLDMKEELRRQGKNVPMAQMSAIAGPKWSVSYF